MTSYTGEEKVYFICPYCNSIHFNIIKNINNFVSSCNIGKYECQSCYKIFNFPKAISYKKYIKLLRNKKLKRILE